MGPIIYVVYFVTLEMTHSNGSLMLRTLFINININIRIKLTQHKGKHGDPKDAAAMRCSMFDCIKLKIYIQ